MVELSCVSVEALIWAASRLKIPTKCIEGSFFQKLNLNLNMPEGLIRKAEEGVEQYIV
jgi:hypothetical protein